MKHRVDSGLVRLGGILLPPRCVLCGSCGQPGRIDLCLACDRSLPRSDATATSGRAPLLRSFAPFAYLHPADYLVHALKYHGQLAVARVLGELLGRHVEAAGFGADVDVLVPVPLHPYRHAERGFNQSEEIARWLGRWLQRRVDGGLAWRRRDTRPQVGLPGDHRRLNVAGAFAAAPGVRGQRVAVVDDVFTTGATLAELARVLHEAGASSVEAWCVARAPAPKQVDFTEHLEV